MIILSSLNNSKEIVRVVDQIIGQEKSSPIYFIGYHPSMELVSVIDNLIYRGYCQHVLITNQAGGEGCTCGRQGCACEMLSKELMPDNLFLFSEAQHPNLIGILPKLGHEVIWVINADHSQKDEIIQWISS